MNMNPFGESSWYHDEWLNNEINLNIWHLLYIYYGYWMINHISLLILLVAYSLYRIMKGVTCLSFCRWLPSFDWFY